MNIALVDDQFVDVRGWSDTMETLATDNTEEYLAIVTDEILRDFEG